MFRLVNKKNHRLGWPALLSTWASMMPDMGPPRGLVIRKKSHYGQVNIICRPKAGCFEVGVISIKNVLFYHNMNLIIKIRRPHDRLFFIFDTPIPRKTVFMMKRSSVSTWFFQLIAYSFPGHLTQYRCMQSKTRYGDHTGVSLSRFVQQLITSDVERSYMQIVVRETVYFIIVT